MTPLVELFRERCFVSGYVVGDLGKEKKFKEAVARVLEAAEQLEPVQKGWSEADNLRDALTALREVLK